MPTMDNLLPLPTPLHFPKSRQTLPTKPGRLPAGKALIETAPIDLVGQSHQRMINDFFQRRPQQILLTIVPWSRHRAPPTLTTRHPIAQIALNRNPKSQKTCHQPAVYCKN
jgi:hypothetical protein